MRKALRERLKETWIRFPKPVAWYQGGVPEMEARVEKEMVKIRQIHVGTIEKVIKFWKARDEGREPDVTFGRWERWSSKHIAGGLEKQ